MITEQIMQHLYGKTYAEVKAALLITEDCGDCCGYAGHSVTDAVEQIEGAESAILVSAVKIEYGEEGEEGSRTVVNFIFDVGDHKGVVLGYDMHASSGSGWSYGASCVLYYDGDEVARADW